MLRLVGSRIPRTRIVKRPQSRKFCAGNSHQAGGQSNHSSSKEIGNPITWANPNNGPSQDDRSSNAWKWVYPVGFGLILLVFLIGSLASRYRNKDEKDEEEDSNLEKIKKDRSLRMYQAMERLDFATKSPKDQAKASDDY